MDKTIIANIGEDLPYNDEFENMENLNKTHKNFPLFDFVATRKYDGKTVLFSAKARNIYDKTGTKYNNSYHILKKDRRDSNGYITTSRKMKKVIQLLENNGYNANNIECAYIICPLEKGKDIYYYWDYFTKHDTAMTINNMASGTRGHYMSICTRPESLKGYPIFGLHKWEYIIEKYGE
jgi:hypothetical protein